jgi:hypothetical protein
MIDITFGGRNKDYETYKSLSKNLSKDVNSFKREINALKKAIETEFDIISANVYTDFFSTLVKRTPILTGNARLNWMINTSGVNVDVIPYPGDRTPIQDRTFFKKSLATKVKGYRSRGYTAKGKRVAGLFSMAKSASVNAETRMKIKVFRDNYLSLKPKSVFIFNNAKHISALEHGHSGQAPNGMLSITVQDFARLIKRHSSGSPIFRNY